MEILETKFIIIAMKISQVESTANLSLWKREMVNLIIDSYPVIPSGEQRNKD